MKQILNIIQYSLIFFLLPISLQAQDNCFQSLKTQGNTALNKDDYSTAIQSFQSIIRNCDKATQAQRSEALSLLNNAYDLNKAALEASVQKAEAKATEAKKNEEDAIRQREEKEVEAINARSSKIAFHASEETNRLDKLTLAYYSKKWMSNIDTISQSSSAAFGDAVQENYKRVENSKVGFVNAATIINGDVLVKGVNGEVTINDTLGTKNFIAHQDHILSITPFKKGFITTSKDHTSKYWLGGQQPTTIFSGHTAAVNGAKISPDQQLILTYSKDKSAKLWDEKGAVIANLVANSAINDALFSNDGQLILTRSQENEVGVWDNKGNLSTKLNHENFVYDADISSDNQFILSSTAGGQFYMWDMQGKVITEGAHEKAIFNIEISSDNQHFLTVGADKKVKLWNKSGELIQTYSSTTSINYAKFIKGQKQFLITAGAKVILYDFSGKKVKEFTHESIVSALKVSKNGQYFLAGTYDNTVKLWSISGLELLALNPFNDQIIGVDFSDTEQHILAYSQDGVVALCPTPEYIYGQLEIQPPVMTSEFKKKYEIK